MMSDAVKIAKINRDAATVEALRDILTNPAILAIAGFVLTENLQSEKRMGTVAGSALEAALAAYMLAPTVGKVAEQIGPLAKSLGPLLAAAGA